jgi:hypothetical protein
MVLPSGLTVGSRAQEGGMKSLMKWASVNSLKNGAIYNVCGQTQYW